MESTGAFLQEIMVLYAMAILGFTIRKIGILNKNSHDVLTQLILHVTLPALILFSLDISFSFSIVKEFFWLISMSVYTLAFSIFIAAWMRRRANLPENQKRVYEGLTIFGNQGFIGYAVCYVLLGEQGVVYLTIFNLCYLILIWTYGVFLFNKKEIKISWKRIFLNPGILSTLTGLVIFIFPIRWPEMIATGLDTIGKMTIPLSMMLIGILIANVKTREMLILLKNIYLWKSAFVKLVLIPLLILPFAVFSIPFSVMVVAVLVSGMPSAPTISLYSQKYDADTAFASFGVLLTTFLCVLTIPFLYMVLTLFFK
jgi:malate permease and related proteins